MKRGEILLFKGYLSDVFLSDFLTIKQYGNNYWTVVKHKMPVRQAGFEDESLSDNVFDNSLIDCSVDERIKLDNNICRARSTIFELSMCNDWDWFFTGTFSDKNGDRTDLDFWSKKFAQFIRNKRRKFQADINYLIVPELHSDLQSWHFHGLLSGLPTSVLKQFTIGMQMGQAIAEKVLNGAEVYEWTDYTKSFGWNDLEPIRDRLAVSKYLTKYISKGFGSDRSVTEFNKHLYYPSQNLQRARTIKKGRCSIALENDLPWDFENDYIRKFSTSNKSLIDFLLNSTVEL